MYEIFFQSEGHTGARVMEVAEDATIRDLMESAKAQGLTLHEDLVLFIEDTDAEHPLAEVTNYPLTKLQIGHGAKIHFHRSRQIQVSVRYDSETRCHAFRPATTIHRIKEWAIQEFKLDASVSVDHGLKVCGQTVFLAEKTHIGTLAHPGGEVCLVLAPKRPVNG